MPLILVKVFDKTTGDCKWNWPEKWMGAANETTWLGFYSSGGDDWFILKGRIHAVVQTK